MDNPSSQQAAFYRVYLAKFPRRRIDDDDPFLNWKNRKQIFTSCWTEPIFSVHVNQSLLVMTTQNTHCTCTILYVPGNVVQLGDVFGHPFFLPFFLAPCHNFLSIQGSQGAYYMSTCARKYEYQTEQRSRGEKEQDPNAFTSQVPNFFSGTRPNTFFSKFALIPKIYSIIPPMAQFLYLLADLFKPLRPHFLYLKLKYVTCDT